MRPILLSLSNSLPLTGLLFSATSKALKRSLEGPPPHNRASSPLNSLLAHSGDHQLANLTVTMSIIFILCAFRINWIVRQLNLLSRLKFEEKGADQVPSTQLSVMIGRGHDFLANFSNDDIPKIG